ncbi:MAG TPA: glycosyltransferase family 2 protein [Anaerolineaceae bacterium]|nr:glycosyltransferase family 2 protein [Anaerolineaceae bacterium]
MPNTRYTMTSPFFSIIVLYWNSGKYLAENLSALAAQTWQDFEVILLDNGSQQPPDQNILAQFPELHLRQIASEKNLGFAAGNNLAARSARGEYSVLLNVDAFPQPDWLEQVHAAIRRHPNAFFASRLLMADDPQRLDGEWNVVHATGLVWRRSHGRKLSAAWPQERHVLSACAAAGVYPREAFTAAGGFDEDFFAYMEDVDLDFRLQLLGYPCYYLPQAVVRHAGSGSTSPRSDLVIFYGHRNLVWTFIKDMPGWLFWAMLLPHLLVNLLYLIVALFLPMRKAMYGAKWEALKGLPKAWKKRKEVQSQRKVSVGTIAGLLEWNPFAPLIKLTYR